jgi:hypothetical protein
MLAGAPSCGSAMGAVPDAIRGRYERRRATVLGVKTRHVPTALAASVKMSRLK